MYWGYLQLLDRGEVYIPLTVCHPDHPSLPQGPDGASSLDELMSSQMLKSTSYSIGVAHVLYYHN